MFSIDSTFDKSVELNESHDVLNHLILKSHEKFTANIKCEQSTEIGKYLLHTEECMYSLYMCALLLKICEIFVK